MSRITIAAIQQAVAERHHVSVRAMKSQSRKPQVVRSRHAAMFLAREMTPHSFSGIARYFGRRHHTTIMYGCWRVTDRISRHPRSAAAISRLEGRAREISRATVDNQHVHAFASLSAGA